MKKGFFHKCGKPGHWANKCPEFNRKSGLSSSSGSRQDRINKHKSWRTIPPLPGTSISQCHRWTVMHATATHTGNERRPPAPAPSPKANLSMLALDPSVWKLDFPVKPNIASPPHLLLNLIRGANPWQLFAFSFAICAMAPVLVNLAIYLASAIPWSTVLAWVANNLHQVVLLLDAIPRRLDGSLVSSVYSQPTSSFLTTPQEVVRSATLQFRYSRQQEVAPLQSSPTPTQGYVTSRPLTITQRDDFRLFATLKERALRLQRCADKLLRTSRRPAMLPPTTGQKGEGNSKIKHSCPPWCSKRSRPSPQTTKYCPVAPVNSPDPFAIAPLTFHQSAATNKACHSTQLRMALQAPARMREALGPKANTSPIIWDSGARSISITPYLSDFEGPVTSPGTITQLKGIAKGGLQVKGQGKVTWAVHDQLGNLQLLKVPAFHVLTITTESPKATFEPSWPSHGP
ncbi:hypothetical protein MHU86_14404 [Fragilaria crotonensis]|nr:hypothetical protein MHU86_14404 [Fragilaria crotonensis]